MHQVRQARNGPRMVRKGVLIVMMIAMAEAIALPQTRSATALAVANTPNDDDPDAMGTFSIIARDPSTGELGMAVQSKAFAAGNRAMTIKGGVAVIAHQASANPMYGSLGL